ncbi:MAG: hypothetical protein FJ167_11990 [Gammaproteobacteria bacterium]|nr:hypothetical protein [Gammaproteobacteria bacterium]
MSDFHIPQTYDEWRHCVTVYCRQPITGPYIEERLEALSSVTDYMTVKFVDLYGEAQRLKTIEWFKKAQREL